MKEILVVERDPALRVDLLRIVQRAGYACSAAASWSDARSALRTRPPHLIIAEIASAEGLASVARAISNQPTLPIIGIITPRDSSRALELRKLGVRAVLRKPIVLRELEDAMTAALTPRAQDPCDTLDIDTRDPAYLRTLKLAQAVSPRRITLLLVGEIGTGKHRLAREIHRSSPERWQPFRRLDTSRPASLDSTLASWNDGGTAVLSNLTRIPEPSQRVLIERWLRSSELSEARFPRMIATAHEPLAAAVRDGRLRADLAHRVSVVTLSIPALRDRIADVPLLLRSLWTRRGGAPEDVPDARALGLQDLETLELRGNVRELENRLHRLSVTAMSPTPNAPALSPSVSALPEKLEDLEREAIIRSLERFGNNRTHASRALGISVRTLRNKIHRYGLR